MDNLNIIVNLRFGSHLYGTNNESSDEDFMGVYLPTKEEVLLNKVIETHRFDTKSIYSKEKDTSKVHSLQYFLVQALEGKIDALDMLHAPANMIVEKDSKGIWDYLVNHREMFYAKDIGKLGEYIRSQAAKYGVKGSRLNDAKKVLDFLKDYRTNGDALKMDSIWHLLPEGKHINFTEADRQGTIFYQVCGKKIQKTVKVNYAYNIIYKFYEQYGKRAKQAANNENIDWKAVSHAIRAAHQVKEMLIDNTITFPLPNASFITQVKNGELDYNTIVAPHLENIMEEVEKLTEESSLPKKPNYKFWEEWLCFVLEDNLFV